MLRKSLDSDVRNGQADRSYRPDDGWHKSICLRHIGVGLQNLMDFHGAVKGFFVLC
ncbi:protein of unknown function [Pseudomonas sp. JV551A1]|uniref:Uncharacterized protein n=1 Tax=Pseudomonas inefficax TaxID=2078786 RepID=A0AAQ1P7Y2_9PSED|nr:protein of unknown function [Pseudomonas sp. JV551A1]SPO61463.1 protein of unknown function [Pseudomonas inefficax]